MGKLVIGNNNKSEGLTDLVVLGKNDTEFTDADEGKLFIGPLLEVDSSGVLSGPYSPNVSTAKTTDFTTGNTRVYPVDATAGAITVTLNGSLTEHVFIKVDAAANNVILTPASGTINGAVSYSLTTQYQKVTVIYDGTNFYV